MCCLIKDMLMQVMLPSGCLEPLVLSWLFIFSSVTEIKYKIFFARSEDNHSSEGAHVVIKYPCFDVITS